LVLPCHVTGVRLQVGIDPPESC